MLAYANSLQLGYGRTRTEDWKVLYEQCRYGYSVCRKRPSYGGWAFLASRRTRKYEDDAKQAAAARADLGGNKTPKTLSRLDS